MLRVNAPIAGYKFGELLGPLVNRRGASESAVLRPLCREVSNVVRLLRMVRCRNQRHLLLERHLLCVAKCPFIF
jgi:hypothetical protein